MIASGRARLASLAGLLAVAFGLALPVRTAAADEVDLALVIAVDVSRSMDFDEQLIQRQGYAAAFRAPDVLAAIRSGMLGRIAVTYMEWAGVGLSQVGVPWTVIGDAASADAFAARLEQRSPVRLTRTSITHALERGADLFDDSGHKTTRRVIDVSGDGPNNEGGLVSAARDAVVGRGIVINGLPLLVRPTENGFGIDNLDVYYRDCVIGGPGSFVLPVRSWQEFPEAVRRKLVLEIADRPAEPPVLRVAGHEAVDCLIGEKIWQERMRNWEWR